MKRLFAHLVLLLLALALAAPGMAQERKNYLLGGGDIVRISVFQNPDMTTEVRVAENGAISFPLIGQVAVGGLTARHAESLIAELLRSGGFVVDPQVSLLVVQMRSQQVSVLGQVNRPGKHPIEQASRLSDMLAIAGGVGQGGGDEITLLRLRNGVMTRQDIDLVALFRGDATLDVDVEGGDVLYVPRAPLFYIYGEVQRPGVFRLEKKMTVMQALSVGGGLTLRGTERGVKINRRGADGVVKTQDVTLNELVQPDDVINVRESLF